MGISRLGAGGGVVKAFLDGLEHFLPHSYLGIFLIIRGSKLLPRLFGHISSDLPSSKWNLLHIRKWYNRVKKMPQSASLTWEVKSYSGIWGKVFDGVFSKLAEFCQNVHWRLSLLKVLTLCWPHFHQDLSVLYLPAWPASHFPLLRSDRNHLQMEIKCQMSPLPYDIVYVAIVDLR